MRSNAASALSRFLPEFAAFGLGIGLGLLVMVSLSHAGDIWFARIADFIAWCF
jgi:hypothetical protein